MYKILHLHNGEVSYVSVMTPCSLVRCHCVPTKCCYTPE